MASDAAALIREGLTLDADQRAVVANALLESLREAPDSREADDDWKAVAERRLVESRSGTAELVEADEHYAELRASLTP